MSSVGRIPIDAERTARFENLYHACVARVYAYARRRSPADIAEDVVADTFAVAWRRLESVPDPALPWLLATARRVLANRTRSDLRRARLLGRLQENALTQPAADRGPGSGRGAEVIVALDRLPPREREAVILVAWDGLGGAEAAAVAGCTRTAFAVRLHRARRRLRKFLEASAHESDDGAVPSPQPVREVPRT